MTHSRIRIDVEGTTCTDCATTVAEGLGGVAEATGVASSGSVATSLGAV